MGWLLLFALTACNEPQPLHLPDPSIDRALQGTWNVTLSLSLTGELAGVEVFTDTCTVDTQMTVSGDALTVEPVRCDWREGSEELRIEARFDPVPWATGAVDGESFYLGFDGGLVREDFFFAQLYGVERSGDASLTLWGSLSASPAAPFLPN